MPPPLRRSVRTRLFGSRLAAALALAAALGLAARAGGLRVNMTASMPRGLWRAVPGTPQRGDAVFFRPDETHPTIRWAREVGVLGAGFDRSPILLKRIVAVPGDLVTFDDGVVVNGRPLPHSRPLARDAAGRLIPATACAGVVSEHGFWVLGDRAERSLDSRYFGPIPRTSILSRAAPLLVW